MLSHPRGHFSHSAYSGMPAVLHQCTVGLSGMILGLITIENEQLRASGTERRLLLGLLSVPTQIYPLALLLMWQFLLPGVSFLAHLAGIVVSHLS